MKPRAKHNRIWPRQNRSLRWHTSSKVNRKNNETEWSAKQLKITIPCWNRNNAAHQTAVHYIWCIYRIEIPLYSLTVYLVHYQLHEILALCWDMKCPCWNLIFGELQVLFDEGNDIGIYYRVLNPNDSCGLCACDLVSSMPGKLFTYLTMEFC